MPSDLRYKAYPIRPTGYQTWMVVDEHCDRVVARFPEARNSRVAEDLAKEYAQFKNYMVEHGR